MAGTHRSQKERIRAKAAELGFCKVGFTTMDDFDFVALEAAWRGYPEFFQGMIERGARPKSLFEGGASIIVLAYDYARHRYPESLLPYVARTYLSRSYLPMEGSPARERLDAFEAFLTDEGIAFEPDRNALMMRPAAIRAGVATFGRNNFAYVDGVGSFVILYGYLVDAAIEADAPTPKCACPRGCRACIDACPTGALSAPFDLDLSRCLLWDNVIAAKRGDGPVLPIDHREAIGTHIHGCDACQVACPRNQAALDPDREDAVRDPVLDAIAQEFSLEQLLHMPEGYYERAVLPIMYNYTREPSLFQRNAAVAMGNSGDARYLSHLEAESDNPDPVVAAHVRWAIDKLTSAR